MAKNSIYQRFMKALKSHWKVALPHVKPLTERRGCLPKASSFEAGVIPDSGQRLYLEFQTTWKEAGYFTINLIVVDKGRQVSPMMPRMRRKPDGSLEHGGHRIGGFVDTALGDKWWHLCEVEEETGWSDDTNRIIMKGRLRRREENWTAANYVDEKEVIDAAVADVTRDVEHALKAIGIVP